MGDVFWRDKQVLIFCVSIIFLQVVGISDFYRGFGLVGLELFKEFMKNVYFQVLVTESLVGVLEFLLGDFRGYLGF